MECEAPTYSRPFAVCCAVCCREANHQGFHSGCIQEFDAESDSFIVWSDNSSQLSAIQFKQFVVQQADDGQLVLRVPVCTVQPLPAKYLGAAAAGQAHSAFEGELLRILQQLRAGHLGSASHCCKGALRQHSYAPGTSTKLRVRHQHTTSGSL